MSHARQVEVLVEGGARFIQLREKNAAGREFYEDALRSVEIARKSGAKIIINDRVDIAMVVEADGVHLGQDDLPPAYARKLLGDAAIIGYSTHNVEQAISATSLPIDYIAFGPIFPTSTKPDPDSAVGVDGLQRVRDALPDTALVAIGGISADSLDDIFAAGADSAALISALFAGPNNLSETYRLLRDKYVV